MQCKNILFYNFVVGKEAIKKGVGFFIKQASEHYRNLPQVDKTRLASISTGFEGVKQKQSVSKQASRIFKIVHNKVFVNMVFCDFFVYTPNYIIIQFQELESLGYSGFAMAFSGFQLFTVNTHDSQICARPEVIDHLRALIISGRIFIFIAYYFISISLVWFYIYSKAFTRL